MIATALALLLLVMPARPPVEPAWKAQDDVVLSPTLRETIDAIAQIYHAKTKRTLEITSGVRTPERQALAMYGKLAAGSSLALYRRQALLAPIKKAYRDGRKKRLPKATIVDAMAAIIQQQVARGELISRHLRGRAFDARSVGLTGKQRAAFMAACREVGGLRVLIESRPPHFHVEVLERAAPPPSEHEAPPDHEPDGDP